MIKPLVAFSLFVLASRAAFADPMTLKDSVPHLVAEGSASAKVVPDQADLRLGVTDERPTASAATAAVAPAASAIIADIKARGIDPKDIKTTFDISAQYEVKKDAQGNVTARTFRGYAAHEGIIVHLRDIVNAGALARAMIDKGANTFESIDYSYSRSKEKQRELEADAIRDAFKAAKIDADAAGLKLGRVLSIGDESPHGDADMPLRRASPNADAVPTEPGTDILFGYVAVVFQLEGQSP